MSPDPSDFPVLMEELLEEMRPMLVSRWRTPEDDEKDLYVRASSGGNKWEVVSKRYGGTGFFILPKDLAVLRGKKERAQQEIADKFINAKEEEREKYKQEYLRDLAREQDKVEEWRQRVERNPSRLNKFIYQLRADHLDERITGDRARARQKEAQEALNAGIARGKRMDRALSDFFKSITPSVKIRDTWLVGGPETDDSRVK